MTRHRNSHASSSHELSFEPTSTRREDLGKHSVYTHFPKDRNCEICERTKITRDPCRRRIGGAVLRAENFGDLITADHRSSVTIVNLENFIDTHSWCKTWPPNGSSGMRARQKLRRKHKGNCKSSWSQIGRLKSFTLTIPWNLAKLVKIFPEIIVRWHHTDQKKWDCWKSSAQSKRSHFCRIVAIRFGWKIGGQIPWNAIPICEIFKISHLMGRPHMRDALGNHLMDQSFHVVHCSPRIRIVCGGIWKGWHDVCRRWGGRNDGRIRNLR